VIVVEAAKRSGSLITARRALEQGREVFAVPGSPLDPRAEGTNGLLKQGAAPVTEAADVVAVLEPILGRPSRAVDLLDDDRDTPIAAPIDRGDNSNDTDNNNDSGAEGARRRILELLGPTPTTIDDLIRLSRASPAIVRTTLLELEIAGRVERHDDGSVSLI